MKKLYLLLLLVFPSLVFSADYNFTTFFNGVTGEVSGSLDNLECSTLGSKDGWAIVKDGTDLSYWAYDWDSTTAEDATHIHCKSDDWTQGVWTQFVPSGAGAGDVQVSGTPAQYEFSIWTDDTTIKGVAVAGDSVVCTDTNGEPEACAAAALLSAAGVDATESEIDTPLDGALVQLTEFRELETIDDTTITAGQWVFVGAQDQATYTTSSPAFVSVTVTGAAGNGGLEIDPYPDTDETCEGIISTVTAGVDSIVVGACLTIDPANSEYIFANAASEDTRCVAIACEDADDQDTFEVMTYGYIREDSMYDFTPNDLIFLEETNGVLIDEDDTLPDSTGDIIQIVGVALTADVFLFNPQLYYNKLE